MALKVVLWLPYSYTHMHIYLHTHTHLTYVCTPRYTNRYTNTHTYAYTQNNNAPNGTFSKYKYVLHILISLSYHMRQNFLSNKSDMVSKKN